jgi:hypothetical protein
MEVNQIINQLSLIQCTSMLIKLGVWVLCIEIFLKILQMYVKRYCNLHWSMIVHLLTFWMFMLGIITYWIKYFLSCKWLHGYIFLVTWFLMDETFQICMTFSECNDGDFAWIWCYKHNMGDWVGRVSERYIICSGTPSKSFTRVWRKNKLRKHVFYGTHPIMKS